MGFTTPTTLPENVNDFVISNVSETGNIFKVMNPLRDEYYLIENRGRTGYDSYLPFGGLCIWHCDGRVFFNNREWYPGLDSTRHQIVALEQSDGLFELEHHIDRGDVDDPFPGSRISNTSFTPTSLPSSNWYLSSSDVNITDFQRNGNVITLDFARIGDTMIEPPDTVVNYPPALNPIGNQSVLEEQPLTFGVSATDANADPISLSASPLPVGATFNSAGGTGNFSWTPTISQSGSYIVKFYASDGVLSDTETILINVTNVLEQCCDGDYRGDVNGDGVDGTEADLRALRAFANKGTPLPDSACLEECDLDYNGLINNEDTKILNSYVRKGGQLPSCIQSSAKLTVDHSSFSVYPNPFNPTTTISFSVLNTSHVELKIFNVTGQLVETLASQEFAAGEHSIQWNAGKYASGLYLAQITIGPDVSLKKILLLK